MLQLSIVVPIYNVEEYLLACLDSINAAITNIEAEVLLIDDGSTDSSSELAREYSKANSAFHYYRKENGGLSDARNYGAARVTGKYMAFVDSDDLVTEDMYETMIRSAELNDTDFVLGNVTRFNSSKAYESELYRYVYSDLQETVTHISQCDNLIYDTITCNKLIRRSFWVENGFKYPVGWRFEDMSVALAMHCRARRVSIVRTAGYLWRARDGETKSITQENSSIVNLQHRLAMIERMFGYIETEMHGDARLKRLLLEKVLSVDLIIYINEVGTLPEKAQEEYRTVIMEFLNKHYTEDALQSLSALRRQKYIDLIGKRYDEIEPLRVYGKSAYYSAPVVQNEDGRKLLLESELFDEKLYDIEKDFQTIEPNVSVTDVGYSDGTMWIDLYCFFRRISTAEGDQTVRVSLLNIVTGAECDLPVKSIIEREATARFGRIYDLAGKKGYDYNYAGSAFRVTLDPEAFGEESYGSNVILIRYSNPVKEGVCFVKTGEEDDLSRFEGESVASDNQKATLGFDAAGCLVIKVENAGIDPAEREENSQAEVISISSKEETCVEVEVSLRDSVFEKADRIELKYEDKTAGRNVLLSSAKTGRDGDPGRALFRIDFSDAALLSDLYDMRSGVVVGNEGSNDGIPVAADKEFHCRVYSDMLAITMMGDRDGKLVLDVRKTDALTINQKAYFRKVRYREFRKEPINNKIIIFESYWASQYSCNPRALYEYIDANHPEYTCVWPLLDERTPINGRGIRVRKSSEEYYRYLATAKYFVNNVNFELSYVKRGGQIEIQTMHGTPFKMVGLDVTDEFRTETARQNYLKKNGRWNYLVAQGEFTKENVRQWYGFDKTVLQTGYPRTDTLFNITEEERKQIKKRLCIPEGKKVILYAPTFRKHGTYEMPLDLEYLREKLSDEYLLLIRLHHFASASYKVPEDRQFIFDAGKYNNINELYKITDVLITDYSSVMFDYALTGKPMILYAYDLEEYKSKTRGVYFDICEEAPGPIVRSDEELIGAILGEEDVYQERIKKFRERYLTYECGNSCEKIFEEAIKANQKISPMSAIIKTTKTILPKGIYNRIKKLVKK